VTLLRVTDSTSWSSQVHARPARIGPVGTGGGTRRVRLVRGEGRGVSGQHGGAGAGRDATSRGRRAAATCAADAPPTRGGAAVRAHPAAGPSESGDAEIRPSRDPRHASEAGWRAFAGRHTGGPASEAGPSRDSSEAGASNESSEAADDGGERAEGARRPGPAPADRESERSDARRLCHARRGGACHHRGERFPPPPSYCFPYHSPYCTLPLGIAVALFHVAWSRNVAFPHSAGGRGARERDGAPTAGVAGVAPPERSGRNAGWCRWLMSSASTGRPASPWSHSPRDGISPGPPRD